VFGRQIPYSGLAEANVTDGLHYLPLLRIITKASSHLRKAYVVTNVNIDF
jgi:hypothetical protein